MILDDIVKYRKIQLEREKANVSFEEIKKAAKSTKREPLSFKKALSKSNISVIAEVKKASPSKSVIKEDFHPVEQAKAYEKAGADAISCLTEEHYFQGSSDYLKEIRKEVNIPILRKDFIIDEYQIYEAKVIGADAILLIAAILDTRTMQTFRKLAADLGLDVLFEAHNREELEKISLCEPEIVGVNNRNLKDFTVSLNNTETLLKFIPKNSIVVSESGIKNHEDMAKVRKAGADAVLIGETLMCSDNIKETLDFLRKDL